MAEPNTTRSWPLIDMTSFFGIESLFGEGHTRDPGGAQVAGSFADLYIKKREGASSERGAR